MASREATGSAPVSSLIAAAGTGTRVESEPLGQCPGRKWSLCPVTGTEVAFSWFLLTYVCRPQHTGQHTCSAHGPAHVLCFPAAQAVLWEPLICAALGPAAAAPPRQSCIPGPL